MSIIVSFSHWLASTNLSWAARGGWPWLWPASETFHFIGMTLLVGTVGLLDLRLMGLAKGLPVGPLERLIPWGIAGFAVNLITGFIFFAGDPFQYIHNYVFWTKLAFIGVAGINALVFYATGLYRVVDATGPGGTVPLSARLIGATSLLLWISVIFWGRMLPFLGSAF